MAQLPRNPETLDRYTYSNNPVTGECCSATLMLRNSESCAFRLLHLFLLLLLLPSLFI